MNPWLNVYRRIPLVMIVALFTIMSNSCVTSQMPACKNPALDAEMVQPEIVRPRDWIIVRLQAGFRVDRDSNNLGLEIDFHEGDITEDAIEILVTYSIKESEQAGSISHKVYETLRGAMRIKQRSANRWVRQILKFKLLVAGDSEEVNKEISAIAASFRDVECRCERVH